MGYFLERDGIGERSMQTGEAMNTLAYLTK
jgi:hypothetical protein